jgi:hypothetical protein
MIHLVSLGNINQVNALSIKSMLSQTPVPPLFYICKSGYHLDRLPYHNDPVHQSDSEAFIFFFDLVDSKWIPTLRVIQLMSIPSSHNWPIGYTLSRALVSQP